MDPRDRHGRTCSGHPRLRLYAGLKTWMPATSAGMTTFLRSFPRKRESRKSFQVAKKTLGPRFRGDERAAVTCELRSGATSRIPTRRVCFGKTENNEKKNRDWVGGTPWSVRPRRGRTPRAAAFSNRRYSVRSRPLLRRTSKTV